jgi:hypothetical protein
MRVETGINSPSLDLLVKIGCLYSVDVNFLLGHSENDRFRNYYDALDEG